MRGRMNPVLPSMQLFDSQRSRTAPSVLLDCSACEARFSAAQALRRIRGIRKALGTSGNSPSAFDTEAQHRAHSYLAMATLITRPRQLLALLGLRWCCGFHHRLGTVLHCDLHGIMDSQRHMRSIG